MGRNGGRVRSWVFGVAGALAVTTVITVVPPSAVAEPLEDVTTDAGVAPPTTPPDQGTPESLDGLQYGDPAAGIDLIEPPEADGSGTAQVAHPIDLPTGRLDWQPQLQLGYASAGGNGWMGQGWDVSLNTIEVPGLGSDVSADSIEVDTRWGVPRYDPAKESETYLFGGEQLAPNAHRTPGSQAPPRVTDRIFTKRVEGDFLRILRHGDHPDNYWWEVHDKLGNKYFYGGVLDDVAGAYTGAGHQVEDAVLKSPKGAYRWLLTEKWDISSNVVSYFYDRVDDDTGVVGGGGTPQAGAPTGSQLYLSRINYTGSRLRAELAGSDPLPRYGPYDVVFLRDSDLGEPRRPDVSIDARHGALEVTAELLRRIRIDYTPLSGGPTRLVRRYDLDYEVGPFDKSLLTSVTKTDSAGDPLSTHDFEYYDDVRKDGKYHAFGDTQSWSPAGYDGDDSLSREYLGVARGSALGATESLGGDGRLFLGASVFSPEKLLAAGGGVQLAGADNESDVELIDINGDNLPDKVWHRPACAPGGASVCYRLNNARPGLSTDEQRRFGPIQGIDNLDHLSEGTEFSVGAGAEAYAGGNVMFNKTWSFSKQTSYFSDVNGDGLPDLVRDGDVLFNHVTDSGRIEFTTNSGVTDVPIDQGNKVPTSIVPDLGGIAQEQAGSFPRQDTIRRWVAPKSGDIEITAPVRLVDAAGSPDGVRVAIQHNGTELWTDVIQGGDPSDHLPTGVSDLHVDRGDNIYFRIGSRNDGAGDRVAWDPTIHYEGQSPRLDVNGKDVYRYTASEDFTVAGLDGSLIGVPYDGRIRVSGDVVKTKPTSDDVHVQLLHNGTVVKEICLRGSDEGPLQGDCNASASDPDTGTFAFETELDVTGRHTDAAGDVVPGDKLSLRLAVDSNIDPNAIAWKPEVRYLSAQDENGAPLPVVDNDGNPTMILKAPYDVDLYPNTDIALPQGTDDEDGVGLRFKVDRDDLPDISLPATVTFTAKTDDGVLRFKRDFTIPAGDGDYFFPGECNPFNGICPQEELDWEGFGGSLSTYYDFTFDDGAVARASDTFINNGTTPSAEWWPGIRVNDDEADVFPPPYRGWGYAGYNADDQRANQPIDEEELVIRQSELPDPDDPPSGFDDPDYNDPVQGDAYPYAPLPSNGLWSGPKFDDSDPEADPLDQRPCPWPFDDCPAPRGTWGGPDQASSSLLGGDVLGAPNAKDVITGDASAPILYAKADQEGVSGGAFGFGGGESTGRSESLIDFQDMNGDGFPDVLSDDEFIYTNETGGYAESLVPELDGPIRSNHQFSVQAGAGGSPAGISTDSLGKGSGAGGTGGKGSKGKRRAGKMLSNFSLSMGVSGSLGVQWSNVRDLGCCVDRLDLADLNGDGLPDRVRLTHEGDIHVRWNLGYGFTEQEALFASADLDVGTSSSTSLDIGLGFGNGLLDFSGGVSLSKQEERATVTWTDLNGDGLDDMLESHVDAVTGDSSGVTVRLNTGAGLGAEEDDFGDFFEDHITRTECTGLGGGADFTVAIPVFKIWYILINPGFHVNKGNCAPAVDLVDVNGDGTPDSVTSSNDGDLDVRPNTTGRTNLLKAVDGPLGSRFELDYGRAGNTHDHPSSVRVLSEVVVHDGHAGDGADQQVTTYQYANGRESRAEREDYGFGTVIEEQRDAPEGDVYRSWRRVYDTTTYYRRGLLQSETLRDGDGVPVTSTRNTYQVVDSTTGDPLSDPTSLTGSAFPRLTNVEESWHDASGTPVKSKLSEYTYDTRGNLLTATDLGEPGAEDDLVAEMSYPDCRTSSEEYPWTQGPADSLVLRSGSTILQRRESTVDCDYASVSQVRDYLDPTSDAPSKVAVTDVCYVPVGGAVSAVIGPSKTGELGANPCGDDGKPDDPGPGRYTIQYEYDDPDRLGAFPTATIDSYDMTSTSVYDNRYGRLVSTTDPVGATTSYTYDVANRTKTVTGPLEQGTGKTTITYEYHSDADDPWVLAQHIDPANPGTTIDTVAFVDGLARQIETKHDATVFTGPTTSPTDRMVVADRIHHDAFGRTVKEFYEGAEALGSPGVYNDADQPFTETEYDVLDRPTKVVQPGARITRHSYGFDAGPFSGPRFTELVEGPGTARSRTFSDVRGDIVAQEQLHTVNGVEQPLLTTYGYDPLQRLTSVTDPTGTTTRATYDLLGRRTALDSPDSGLTELEYDLASNIVSKQTANLRKTNQKISYLYDDFSTPTEVRFPRHPENNITYLYGDPGEAENGAGMLIGVEDGARSTELGYDLLGNVVRETHVMKVSDLSPFNLAKHTFTTRRTYDTWGRELTMTYPDGEKLTRGYDSGGLAASLEGTKGTVTRQYVKRYEYDRFGNQRYREYGNGVTTETSYDPQTKWFTDQLVKKGPQVFSNLHYDYDPAGNVLKRTDTRPVPPSSQLGGPSSQTFTYDDLNRLTSATGTYSDSYRRTRTYTLSMGFDSAGRVSRKTQTDKLGPSLQLPTTYDLAYDYNGQQPHAPSHVGTRTNTWDADGNLTSWKEDAAAAKRTATWSEDGRMLTATDGSSITKYRYDAFGQLSIVLGPSPQGETELVNREYTVIGGLPWKGYYMNDEQVAVTRVHNSPDVLMYYQTHDLTDTTYLVTDATKLLEHALVLPSGQPWVQELSNLNRVRYPFAGGYYDSAKAIYGMGDRWYDPRYGLFYSSDPILLDDLTETIEQPVLANAYLYADGNPTSLTDETGNDAESAQLNNVAAPLPPANGQNRSSKGVIDTLFPKISDDEQKAMDSKAKALGFIANPMKVNVNLSDMDLEIGGFGVRESIKAVAQKVGLAVFKAFW